MHMSRELRRQTLFCRGKGGTQRGCYEHSPLEDNENFEMLAFHWLSYNSFSLAEWLLGEEKILLPADVVVKEHLPVGDGI